MGSTPGVPDSMTPRKQSGVYTRLVLCLMIAVWGIDLAQAEAFSGTSSGSVKVPDTQTKAPPTFWAIEMTHTEGLVQPSCVKFSVDCTGMMIFQSGGEILRLSLSGRSSSRLQEAASAFIKKPAPFLKGWCSIADGSFKVIEVTVQEESRCSVVYTCLVPPEIRAVCTELEAAVNESGIDEARLSKVREKLKDIQGPTSLPLGLKKEDSPGMLEIPNAPPQRLVAVIAELADKNAWPWSEYWTIQSFSFLAHLKHTRLGEELFALYEAHPRWPQEVRAELVLLSAAAGCSKGMPQLAGVVRQQCDSREEYLSELVRVMGDILEERTLAEILKKSKIPRLEPPIAEKAWAQVIANIHRLKFRAETGRYELGN